MRVDSEPDHSACGVTRPPRGSRGSRTVVFDSSTSPLKTSVRTAGAVSMITRSPSRWTSSTRRRKPRGFAESSSFEVGPPTRIFPFSNASTSSWPRKGSSRRSSWTETSSAKPSSTESKSSDAPAMFSSERALQAASAKNVMASAPSLTVFMNPSAIASVREMRALRERGLHSVQVWFESQLRLEIFERNALRHSAPEPLEITEFRRVDRARSARSISSCPPRTPRCSDAASRFERPKVQDR